MCGRERRVQLREQFVSYESLSALPFRHDGRCVFRVLRRFLRPLLATDASGSFPRRRSEAFFASSCDRLPGLLWLAWLAIILMASDHDDDGFLSPRLKK